MVAALVTMVVTAPFLPASRAALPNLVGLDDLTWANGVLARTFAVAITAGPALGGALVGPIGAKGVVLGSAGCSLVAGFLCLRIHGSFAEGSVASDQERGGVLAGLVFIGREPLLRAIVIAEVVAFTGSGLAIVADAPLAVMFDVGALGYGALIILWGLGMLVGSR